MQWTARSSWQHAEPVLLVGETGTGKTSACQRLAQQRGQRLHIVNCNQHTEAADLLGGYRPARYVALAFGWSVKQPTCKRSNARTQASQDLS